MSESLNQCYDLLNKTGRAFGLTINFLNEELRDALCVYYLVQRAVDTVEDDMTIPNDLRVTMLTSFDEYLRDPTWKYTDSNDEYAVVLANFPYVTQALHQLPKKYSDIILECAAHIGLLMTTFVGREFVSMEDINEYCRKVVFLNFTGTLELFVAAGLEVKRHDMSLMVEVYTLIQKTNILRDFNKDLSSGRLFYPRDVWSKYVSSPGDFLEPENFDKGVECVNELVTDVLHYVVPCLQFLKSLRSNSAIKFFGIHQVMAIATIERCYNNPEVLTESVKIGREDAAEIIESASSLRVILDKVRFFTERIMDKSHLAKGRTHSTLDICHQIVNHIEQLQLS